MPPKKPAPLDPDAVLPLQEWIRLLTGQGAPMRAAMAFAGKAYKDYNTRAKLGAIDTDRIKELVEDKDARKVIINAVKGISVGQSPQKKWKRDDDLLHPLNANTPVVPESFEFHEIREPEDLLAISLTVNRAPLKTAWAYCVARRLGFDVEESLSLAHVYVHIGSLKHALALGNILNSHETREAEEEIRELPGEANYHTPGSRPVKEEHKVGSSQPWVGLMRSNPVIERPDGMWRAIQKGVPVEPSVAFLYITRAFKTFTPHVMGALQLVAESYTPEELDSVALDLYSEFKPDVERWGQRGSVSVAKILEQIKGPVELSPDYVKKRKLEETEDVVQDGPVPSPPREKETNNAEAVVGGAVSNSVGGDHKGEGNPSKKAKKDADPLSVEEYEAMLDAEFDEALYQF